MLYYPIKSNNITLNPLYKEEALNQLDELCHCEDFLANSKIYSNELNLSDSTVRIKKLLSTEEYCQYNRLYNMVDIKASKPFGIIGLKNINWIEHRAEVVLVMDDASTRNKLSYEPLKLLLKKALNEWQIRRTWIRVFSKDSLTITVLKGFGFFKEGTLREEVYLNSEYIDVDILGLLKGEFHIVD